MNKPDPSEVEAVFNVILGDRTLEAAAAASKVEFVRSQIQIAIHNPHATGMRLVAQEALRMFGWPVLRQLAHRNAVPIIRSAPELGGRFAEKRHVLGVSLEGVSNLAEISSDELALFENGRRKVPVRLIERIAQILSVDAFSDNALTVGERELAMRTRSYCDNRSVGHGVSQNLVLHLSQIGWIVKRQSELQGLFGCDNEAIIRQKGFVYDNNYNDPTYRRGYKLAHKTRQLLGLSQEEPINGLRSLVEDRLGIPIVQADLPVGFAGATLSNGAARGIVLNLQGHNKNPWIRRNTLAHELGHLLWDPPGKLNSLRVDNFSQIEPGANDVRDPVEARANAFATEFLAPQSAVMRVFTGCSSYDKGVFEVCNTFGISPTTARYHIRNTLRYDSASEHPVLRIDPSTDWFASENFTSDILPDANNVPVMRRGKFSYWVAKAAMDGLISLDTAESYLGIGSGVTIDQLRKIVDLFSPIA